MIDRGADDLESTTRAMRDRLAHRGPDGAGLRVWPDHGVGLGHRRLAIIDPSSAGEQPLSNEDGTVWVTFNGEICNFRSLRAELERLGHIFRSQTDTEVIVHAYEEWGDAHVHRLRGFFAYVLYDRRPRPERSPDACRVLLVRDRLGVKPLYYSVNGARVAFGSEIKALLAHPGVTRRVDRSALFDYFTYSCVPAPKTAYADIRQLLPGHLLTIEAGGCVSSQYWDAPGGARTSREIGDVDDEVRAGLEEAVALYMVSDVGVGSLLSGGIDSSTLTALMAGIQPGLPAFSLGFDDPKRNETPHAAMVADHLGAPHHITRVDASMVPELPARMLDIYDEPFADGSAVPAWMLAGAVRRHVKVVLSGDGGDEVFGGYNRYWSWLGVHQARRPRSWRRLPGWLLRQAKRPDPFRDYARHLELFSPEEKRARLAPEWAREFDGYDDYWNYRQHWRMDLEPATRLQYLDLKTYLPDDILTKVDRASMAESLEVRPPLLDHELVERLLSLPAAVRTPHGQGKFLLKRAARGLLPDAILQRPKQGFSAPWTAWITTNEAWATRELEPSSPGLFRTNLATEPSMPRYGEKVWAALLADRWLRSRT